MAADTDRLKGEVSEQIDSGEERVEFLMRHFVRSLVKEQHLPEIVAQLQEAHSSVEASPGASVGASVPALGVAK